MSIPVASFISDGADTTVVTIKSGAGVVYGYDLGVADGYEGNDATVYFYDDASPTYGETTPLFQIMLKTNVGKTWFTSHGIAFVNAITAIAVCVGTGTARFEGFVHYQ